MNAADLQLEIRYKLAYLAGETRRLKEEIQALDVDASIQTVFLSALEVIERRSGDLGRQMATRGH